MAKKLIQILAAIMCLLLWVVVYFTQVNNNKMVMLSGKLLIATFLIFLFVSLLLRLMESETGKMWHIVAIIGGFLLAYPSYVVVNHIPTSSFHYHQTADIDGLGFTNFFIPAGIALAGLAALICGLANTKGGHHD